MQPNRRHFLRQVGLGLIAVKTAATLQYLSPAKAHAEGIYTFSVLSQPERATLASLGEILVPGCVAEGFCEFIDYHLSLAPEDSLLMLRYLGVTPPYADFYRGGLAALETLAAQAREKRFTQCDTAEQVSLVKQIATGQPDDWQGPPAPLFYFALRSDAVDVYYGTQKGFERLDTPYMAHIEPVTPW